MARVLAESGFADEARPVLLEAIYGFGCALAVESRFPEPADVKDSAVAPLSHQWKEALPAVSTFVNDATADWKDVAQRLATG